MSKGEYVGAGFILGLFLAIGIDPVGVVLDVLETVFKEITTVITVGSGILIIGLLVFSLYKLLNKAEPVITVAKTYQQGGSTGVVALILGFFSGLFILTVTPLGVILLVIGGLLDRAS